MTFKIHQQQQDEKKEKKKKVRKCQSIQQNEVFSKVLARALLHHRHHLQVSESAQNFLSLSLSLSSSLLSSLGDCLVRVTLFPFASAA